MLDSVQKVGTPEGLEFDLHPAGPVPRFLALLLDSLLGLVIFGLLAALFVAVGVTGSYVMYLLVFVQQTFTMIVFELLLNGASPGKRALGLQVVMTDGRPVTAAASFIRNLLRFPDQFLVLGWLLPLVTPSCQRLGDLAGGTMVVYRPDLWLRVANSALPDSVKPLPPQRALGALGGWAAVEFSRRWADFSPGLRTELAAQAVDLYRSETGSQPPDEVLRSVAAWYGGRR